MTKDNQEYKTGRNFSSHDRNNPVDYKKVRRDVFNLVEQLICSNTILTASLQHNEVLQKKCLKRIQDMKAKIEELEHTCSEHEGTEFILREKLEEQRQNIIDQEHNKVFKPDCKKEVN